MRKKEILLWAVIGLLVFGLGFGITALVDWYNSKPKASFQNPDGLTEKEAAAQAEAVSAGLSYYSKNVSANMEAILEDLKSSSRKKNKNSQ